MITGDQIESLIKTLGASSIEFATGKSVAKFLPGSSENSKHIICNVIWKLDNNVNFNMFELGRNEQQAAQTLLMKFTLHAQNAKKNNNLTLTKEDYAADYLMKKFNINPTDIVNIFKNLK